MKAKNKKWFSVFLIKILSNLDYDTSNKERILSILNTEEIETFVRNNKYKLSHNKIRYFVLCDFLKNKKFLEGLKLIISSSKNPTTVGSWIRNDLIKLFPNEVENVFKQLKLNFPKDINLMIAYFRNKLHYCKVCNKPTLRIYCSIKCANKDPEFISKKEQTILNKYGVTHIAKSKIVRDKFKKTIREKYGVDNVSQNKEIRNKINKTNLEKYGHINCAHGSNEKKIEETMLKKYGKKHFNNVEKRRNTLLKKYGVIHNNQKSFNHYNELTKEFVEQNFIKDNKFLLEDFQKYFNLSLTVAYRYKKYFDINFNNVLKKIQSSRQQTELFNWIPEKNKILNDRTVINPYEIDIYLPDKKIGIEYNGIFWHSSLFNTNKNYHLMKTNLCKENGIQLFHIFENDDIEIWKSIILSKLGLSKKIYARNCFLKEIPALDAKIFCDNNHLQGGVFSKINLGLFYENNLVSVMTFSKPRFNKDYNWELIRFCSLKNTTIVGGASKMFNFFIKNNNGKIISYANKKWSNGNLYKQLGFKYVKDTAPGFSYVIHGEVFSRLSLQKHKLKFLKEYSKEKTAEEILSEAGYGKIYDCGNQIWEFDISKI